MSKRANLVACLLSSIAILGLVDTPSANAQSAQTYNIAPKPLVTALKDFTAQSHEQLLATGELINGKSSPGVSGLNDAATALARLLEGTGLTFRRSGRIFLIVKSGEPPAPPRAVAAAQIQAQPASPPLFALHSASVTSQNLEEIVVTASRVRSGFSAPTPTAMIGQAQMQTRGATNVADVINEAPQFKATHTATSTTRSSGFPGGTFLDLRGLNGNDSLGVARTLVLVDGRRFTPTTANMQVDLNMIPSSLLDRTEVVTGGASAAWGSDAVAGVANLILKDQLQGVQGAVGYGVTDKSDYREYSANLAAGTGFAGGRGHVIAGFDYVNNGGVGDPMRTRDWGRLNPGSLILPSTRAGGLPQKITANGVTVSNRMTPGGVIVGGPLAGTMFLPGGQTAQFVAGPIIGGNQMLSVPGASNADVTINGGSHLADALERHTSLIRLNYDLTSRVTGYVELSEGGSRKNGLTGQRRDDGSITVQRDNAFLPETVRAAMAANNLSTITVGRIANDPGYGESGRGGGYYKRYTKLELQRIVGGLKGSFGSSWNWDSYVEAGRSHYISQGQATIQPNYFAAIDAVKDADGAIVCRPGAALALAAPGCAPFNIFGQGSPSQAAINYVLTYGVNNLTLDELAGAATLSGDLFTLPAGPVSVAVGLEYRRNGVNSVVSADSQAGRLDTSAFQPIHGELHDEEIYAEAVIPLLKDLPFAHHAEFNAAVRETNYSTSGAVTTWKVGATFEPTEDFRLRFTRSRDIRAPNLNELYQKGQGNFATVINPITGLSGQILTTQVGNLKLKPEEADTVTGGIVFQPTFFRGFRASVDYYSIKINGVIAALLPQQIVDQCTAGNQLLCSDIELNGSTVTRITIHALNFNKLETSGFDLVMAYRAPPDFLRIPGVITLGALGTNTLHQKTTNIVGAIDRAGQTSPKWSWNLQTTYDIGLWSANAQVRYESGILIDATFLDPSDSGYNAAALFSTNKNHQPDATYLNLSLSYTVADNGGRQVQVYGVANNVFDSEPPPGSSNTNNNSSPYDLIGELSAWACASNIEACRQLGLRGASDFPFPRPCR